MQKDYNYHKLNSAEIPKKLKEIPSPPKQLFLAGESLELLLARPTVAIIGSRKPTPYGRSVTGMLVKALVDKNVVIISGLALGIDSIAHQTTVERSGQTIAVLPCGPDIIYPSSHRNLATRILQAGGSLLTEYPPHSTALKSNFIARNRLVSALADVVIVVEAAEKSGTLHTVNFALDQGRTVMAVPGPITSAYSRGTNNLIKTGAQPITEPKDIFRELNLADTDTKKPSANSPAEYAILALLASGITDGHQLQQSAKLPPAIFNQTLTLLEINGQIQAIGNNQWRLQ